ncbi:MAG: transglutaminase-like domain-containing protein [Candidatus Omnitrophota bacterium]|jgi:hypothetical protein
MKKAIAASWTYALIIAFLTLFFLPGNASAQQIFSRTLSLRNLAADLKSPEAVAQYLWRNFAFEKDQRQFGVEDLWQSPDQFLETRKGDCEDFSLFAYEILKMNGIKAFVFNVYGNGFGHSVCVFMENGRYNLIDGGTVTRLDAADLQTVAESIDPFWKSASVVIPHGSSLRVKVLKTLTR